MPWVPCSATWWAEKAFSRGGLDVYCHRTSAAVRQSGQSYAYSVPPLPARISEEEYEAILERSVEKLEVRNGQIVAMAGGGDTHSLAKGNLIRHIGNAFRGRACRVYDSDMK